MSHYDLKGIVLVPTYECPALCAHCCVPLERLRDASVMPLDLAFRVLEEFPRIGPRDLQISGGEPTLHPEWIVSVVAEAIRAGYRIQRFPTNGWLGGYPARLKNFLIALKEAGFDSGMRLSVDGFHKRVPVSSLSAFVETFVQVFDPGRLTVGVCLPSGAERDGVFERFVERLNRDAPRCEIVPEKNRLLLDGRPVKLGRWNPTRPTSLPLRDKTFRLKTISGDGAVSREKDRPLPIEPWGCLGPRGVGRFWVEPDGNVRVCSGNSAVFTDALIVGNARESSMQTLIDRVRSAPLYEILSVDGPLGLARMLKDEDPAFRVGALHTHRCELCHRILGDPKFLDKLEKQGVKGYKLVSKTPAAN